MIGYAIREFFASIRTGGFRWLLAVSTVSISMLMLCGILFLSENTTRGIDNFRSVSKIEIILRPDASALEVTGKVLELPGVARADPFTQAQTLEYFESVHGRELAEGISGALGENPFPSFIEVQLTSDQVDPEPVARIISEMPGVEDVIYGAATAQRLRGIAQVIRSMTYIIGAIVTVFVVLIVINNVRLTIHARGHEIYVSRLVGATPGYITLPFVLEGGFVGLLGSLLGGGGLYALWYLLAPHIPYFRINFLSNASLAAVIVLGFAVGSLGGYLAASETVRRDRAKEY